MKNALTRAAGYFAEGATGIAGIEGAHDVAPSISSLLNVNMPLESLNAVISTAMQLIITAVTLWRMIRPKKPTTVLVSPDLQAGTAQIVPTVPQVFASQTEPTPGTEINPPYNR